MMDHFLLSQVIRELDEVLRGGRIERISQNDRGDLFLFVARNRKRFFLLLSPDPTLPRIHLLSNRPELHPAPSGFELFLKSHLSGATIKSISMVNDDRIVEIRCPRTGKEYRIIFELFGPHSNLLLSDGSSRILAVLRPVLAGDAVERPLVAGLVYTLPQRGRSPGDRGAEASSLPASVSSSEGGEIAINRAVEQFYTHRAEVLETTKLRKELTRLLDKALKKAERKASAIREDLLSAERSEEHRLSGELILANLGSIRRGAESALLKGPDGADSIIRLDPRRSPAENAEIYFRKYKKAKAGRGILSGRLEEALAEIDRLKKQRSEVDSAPSLAVLSNIRERTGHREMPSEGTGRRRPGTPAAPYRMFHFEGWEILVGKNAAGNDVITREISRPDDLWLHAEGSAGSHVLVRNPGRTEVPRRVLLKAASLAASYSRAKGSTKVPVSYTEAKYVRRPKGAPPGLVTLLRRRTVIVAPGRS